jgi:hypothetical protein
MSTRPERSDGIVTDLPVGESGDSESLFRLNVLAVRAHRMHRRAGREAGCEPMVTEKHYV